MRIPSSKPKITTPLLSKAEIDEASPLIQSHENTRTNGDLEKDISFPTADSTLTRTGRAWVAVRQLYTRRFLFEMLVSLVPSLIMLDWLSRRNMVESDLTEPWMLLLQCTVAYVLSLFMVGTMIFIVTLIRGGAREPIINGPVKQEDQN
jgi:hypothetical protein